MAWIDFHLHFFSRPFFEALAAQSPQAGSVAERLERVAQKARIELPSADLAAHTRRWTDELERHGVGRAAAFASLSEEIPALAEAAVLSDGRLVPIALVNPRADGAAERVRGLLRDRGFRGVLLFPAMHHFDVGGPETRPLLAVLAEFRAVAYVHCGLLVVKLRDLLGLPRPFDLRWADPLRVVPAANAFRDVRFVIPHFGAGFFREALMAGASCENVHVDSSSSNSWIATQPVQLSLQEVFERTLGVFGHERILFGTDSNVFPAGWRAERLAEQRDALTALGASAEAQAAIFGGNAARLLEP
jgi:predicted TIM-barrel fold metal-dependent hydrolase